MKMEIIIDSRDLDFKHSENLRKSDKSFGNKYFCRLSYLKYSSKLKFIEGIG